MFCEIRSLIISLFFQGMDRGAILVYAAALGFFCFLTDISVHSDQMYKSKTQACEEEEAGSFQTKAPCGSVNCVLQRWFLGSRISRCGVGSVASLLSPRFFDNVTFVKSLGHNVRQHVYQSVSLKHLQHSYFI